MDKLGSSGLFGGFKYIDTVLYHSGSASGCYEGYDMFR